MNISGCRLQGLLWLPRNEAAAIYPCNHRHNALATVSVETDTAPNSTLWMAEYFAWKYNQVLTVFNSPADTIYVLNRPGADAGGKLAWEIYFLSDRWRDPTIASGDFTTICPVIPDYRAAEWTVAGVVAFSGAVLGAAKADYYPDHGQEMYDISAGDYGYDVAHSTPGATDVLTGVLDGEVDWYYSIFGRLPRAASYRNGQTAAAAWLLPYFLGARNSIYTGSGDSLTTYGRQWSDAAALGTPNNSVNHAYAINRACAVRWLDMGGTAAARTTYCTGEITKAIAAHGWWNNFTHFHNLSTPTIKADWRTFMAAVASTIGASQVHWAGYGEALAYLMLRKAVTRMVAFVAGGRLKIHAILERADVTVPPELLTVPLSIFVDISSTTLVGEDLAAYSSNVVSVRKTATDQFVIEVDCSEMVDGAITAELASTESPAYLSLALPAISSISYDAGVVTIVTDVPTRCALFYAARSAEDYNAELLTRDNTLATTHSIDLNSATVRDYQRTYTLAEIVAGDVYVGVVSAANQSIMSTVQRWG